MQQTIAWTDPCQVKVCGIPRDAQSIRSQHACYLTLISGSALAVKASFYNLYASLIVFHFCHSFSISHMLLKVLKTLYLIFPSLFHQGTDSYCSKSHFLKFNFQQLHYIFHLLIWMIMCLSRQGQHANLMSCITNRMHFY